MCIINYKPSYIYCICSNFQGMQILQTMCGDLTAREILIILKIFFYQGTYIP